MMIGLRLSLTGRQGGGAGTAAASNPVILLSGDMQAGTDKLLLSGDMQSGTDKLQLSGT